MPSVFPVMPSFGYEAGVLFEEILRVYANLSYRRYKKSNTSHDTRRLTFEDLSETEYADIKAFFKARKQAAGSDQEFYVYDPDTVNSIDLSGVSATGRHTAIFLDSEIGFVRDGPCTYSGEVTVLFLN